MPHDLRTAFPEALCLPQLHTSMCKHREFRGLGGHCLTLCTVSASRLLEPWTGLEHRTVWNSMVMRRSSLCTCQGSAGLGSLVQRSRDKSCIGAALGQCRPLISSRFAQKDHSASASWLSDSRRLRGGHLLQGAALRRGFPDYLGHLLSQWCCASLSASCTPRGSSMLGPHCVDQQELLKSTRLRTAHAAEPQHHASACIC